ncbi:hypothetical protein [Idiomarina sp.]|uniref:hypothetical protein n=1 Tax=Idiomarina sp. TaxID=1874361 RepID=UPI002EB9A084|nr:hypothetical protein [Pseudomonadota bacterium]
MPYCQTNFRAVPPERVEEVLSLLTKESFVGGQSAYQLDDDTYSVDAGEAIFGLSMMQQMRN